MNNPQSSDELYEQRKVEELEEKELEYENTYKNTKGTESTKESI